MRADHVFKVLDVHAGGNPARIIYSGLPRTSGATMMDKMREFQANHDWIRSAMVLEPHGGNNTSAVVLTDPVSPLAHVGAFFMEAHGYLPMCGSDTLALATALIESGQVAATGPETVVRIDTPAGLIEARAVVDGLKVTSVTFLSAPAFCLHHLVPLTLPTGPTLTVDVAYGGNFYVLVDALELGVTEFDPTNTAPMVALAHTIRTAVNAQYDIQHPEISQIRDVTHVLFFLPPLSPGAPTRDMVVMPTGAVDRSPCGTGTTSKVATLTARGQLPVGQPFTHISPIGSTFTGRAVETMTVGDLPACRVAITGSAYITADSTLFVDHADELSAGFQLS